MRRLSIGLAIIALLAGIALTIFGMRHLQWPQDLPWMDSGALLRYVLFLFACTALVVGVAVFSKRGALFSSAIIAGGFAVLTGSLWPLLVTIWFFTSSMVLGKIFLRLLRIGREEDKWLIDFLVGAGLYGTIVGLLAHYSINYPGVYGAALALPLLLGWRSASSLIRELANCCAPSKQSGLGLYGLDMAIAVVGLFYFVVALMPEVGYDALAMHMFIPAHLATRHAWGFDASNYVWAVMPMLGDWIFSIGYMLAGETAARLINVGFIFTLGFLVRELVVWAGGSTLGSRWAVLIFLSTPLTFTEGGSLFIESIWASFVVAGTLYILGACSTSGKLRSELPVAGLLLGCALAAKAVTFTILPVLLLLLIWRYKSWFKTTGLPWLALGLCLFFVVGIIPYVTAWRLTGNPVFPFFNYIFHSAYYPIAKDAFSAAVFNQGMTWDVLYKVTFEPGKYLEATIGASGFQWLLMFVSAAVFLIFAGERRSLALIIIGGLAMTLTFHSTSYLRYVFPAWVILIAVIGVALDRAQTNKSLAKYTAILVATGTVTLNLLFINAGGFYRDFDLRSLLSIESRELYLERRLPMRKAVEFINALNTTRSPVAVFANPQTAGLTGNAFYPNWYNSGFQSEIAAQHTDKEMAHVFLKRGIDFIILDANWNGVNCCSEGAEKQALIEKVTEKIAEYGSLSIRKLKPEYRFSTELLSNADFSSIKGWDLSPGAKYDPKTGVVLASVVAPVVQSVAISPGGRYLNSVVARCATEQTSGRVQINWMDAKGQFVNADIRTFECTPGWIDHTMEVLAPLTAAVAIVYVSGHTAIPLEFKTNSLRQ